MKYFLICEHGCEFVEGQLKINLTVQIAGKEIIGVSVLTPLQATRLEKRAATTRAAKAAIAEVYGIVFTVGDKMLRPDEDPK